MNIKKSEFILIPALLLITACGGPDSEDNKGQSTGISPSNPIAASSEHTDRLVRYTEQRTHCADYNPQRKPLFGDLHVHTALSFDAVAGRINTMPRDAYNFAKGEPIPFFPQDPDGQPTGTLKIDRPLDFLAVTDHGEFLGERELCTNENSPQYDGEFCVKYREIEFRGTLMVASVIGQQEPERIKMLCGEDGNLCRDYVKGPWQRIIDAAETAYDRSAECSFTSFIGYEYTGTPENSNYHRNVIFRNANTLSSPVSYIEAPLDYMLWEELDRQCGDHNNCDYLTIPHNSNLSNGKLLTPYADLELTPENKIRYAKARLNSEPLMEIFQHKGGSECVNGLKSVLGAADELCDVEQVRIFGERSKAKNFHLEGADVVMHPEEDTLTTDCGEGKGSLGMFAGGCISKNDFLRTALLTGLQEERETGLNPVKLGVIASTDGHTGTPGDVVESEWRGSVSGEMSIQGRLKPGTLPSGIKGNPGGLAGVWAVENSRDAIFDALQRREVFGTSGPRIVPRFFGGWNYPQNSCELPGMVTLGYDEGVPMGGDLIAPTDNGAKPTFILAAKRDPAESATPLQQLQIIKGWIDAEGQHNYKVIAVAGTPDNSAGVDTETGQRYGEGHNSLCAVYRDSDFDPSLSAYYYLRAVENPSPRWSLLDCLKLEPSQRPEICSDPGRQVIREMAWSSPIWYRPAQ